MMTREFIRNKVEHYRGHLRSDSITVYTSLRLSYNL
jgi:hypothetical protein